LKQQKTVAAKVETEVVIAEPSKSAENENVEMEGAEK
jgi:hypothetical protein